MKIFSAIIITVAFAKKASMALNAEPKDKTHLNQKGAKAIANLVVINLKQAAPDIAACLKK